MNDPFAILGLAPTRELGAVKRAWFTALPKHPPESDPEGFRRLRDAYEQLSTPAGLTAAFASAPLDLEVVRAQYAARFDTAIEAHGAAMTARLTASVAVEQFVQRFSAQSCDEALRSFEG